VGLGQASARDDGEDSAVTEYSPTTALGAMVARAMAPESDIRDPILIASNWIVPVPGQEWSAHRHPEHELLWGVDGTVTVDVGDHRFVVPPRHGLWVPCGLEHRVVNLSATRLTCTWLSPEYTPWSGRETLTLPLSTLLQEVLEHLRLPDQIPEDVHEVVLATRRRAELFAFDLLDGELDAAWSLPLPTTPALRELAEAMQEEPGGEWSVVKAARFAQTTERTLRRRFVAETGMGFAQWRRRLRVHTAIGQLRAGATVAAVARGLGYRSVSAFTQSYREVTGHTPSDHARLLS
jgi:AraC-like DNA-binding protein/mannose-6-phosphate isomerase-like protein (cupin superfamily)